MTLSIELLPAPLGPMMARISCSRTSKLMSVSALTPPKESEIASSLRTTSPMPRALLMKNVGSGSLAGRAGGQRLRVSDFEIGGHASGATVFEFDLRLDVLHRLAAIQRVDQHGIFLRDESAAHLARAGELVVVRIELLVQDQEAAHLRVAKRPFLCELRVDLFHAFAHKLVDLRLRGKVGIAGIGNPAPLRPVADRSHVDVDESADFLATVTERHRLLD